LATLNTKNNTAVDISKNNSIKSIEIEIDETKLKLSNQNNEQHSFTDIINNTTAINSSQTLNNLTLNYGNTNPS